MRERGGLKAVCLCSAGMRPALGTTGCHLQYRHPENRGALRTMAEAATNPGDFGMLPGRRIVVTPSGNTEAAVLKDQAAPNTFIHQDPESCKDYGVQDNIALHT